MARKGRVDRGLRSRTDAAGKVVWYVRLFHQGRERLFGSFRTKTEAREFYHKAKDQQRQGIFFPETYQQRAAEPVQAILDDYMVTTAGKRSVKREREFARWWGNWFKGQRTPALQAATIERARLELAKGLRYADGKETIGAPRAGATINRYTDWLRHVFNWAVKQKRIRENPVLAIERKPEDEAPIYQYSLEQEARLIEQLNEEEVDLLRLAILTGLRQGNQFTMRKDQVNLGMGVILIPRTKNRKPRIVHLSEETKEILRRQMARHLESPWVFPGTRCRQRPLDARWWYRTQFKPACRRAGIPVHDIRQLWHAARHTFGSRLAGLQYKEKAIMDAGGWTSSQAAQRYLHLHDSAMKEAAERLSAMKPNGTGTRTGQESLEVGESGAQVLD
ncbi:tyrosine-type recombinase/integrase [Nitrospira sp. Nam80]